MALPVFRSVTAKSAGAGAQSPGFPSGIVAGDLIFLVASTIAGGSLSITTNGSISTWNALSGSPIDVTGGEKLYVWWGVYLSGSTGPTVTPGSDHCIACTIAYSGCALNTPIHVSNTGTEVTSDTSFSFVTGLTSLTDNTLVLCIASHGNDSNTATVGTFTNASLAAIANRADYSTNAGGGGGFGINEGSKVTAGSLGTWAGTYSAASPKSYITFAINGVTDATITGKARIRTTVDKTITGKAKVNEVINKKRWRPITLFQPASSFSNFPVLISGTYSYLKTVANGGLVENANGYDIEFYDSSGVRLAYERVSYDATTGTIEYWVKIPTYLSTQVTTIYISYGNPDIANDRSDKINVWTSYLSAWHLGSNGALSLLDSKDELNGTNFNSVTGVTGQIGIGSSHDTSNYIASSGTEWQSSIFTYSMWIKPSSGGTIRTMIGGSKANNVPQFRVANDDKLELVLQDISSIAKSTDTLTAGNWYHIVLTYAGTGAYVFYINGVASGSGTNLQSFVFGSSSMWIGARTQIGTSTPVEGFSGIIDEVHITSQIRNANWVATEYSNQNDPANFYTIGAEISNLQTGKANIRNTTDRTITGKASIGAGNTTVDATTTGKARITATTDRTTTGKARIQKVVDATTTGKARIQKVVDATTTGKARITATTDRTQTGKADIRATTDRTTTGKARIQKVVDATQTGKANILVTVTTDRTTTGKARITAITDRTTTGKARITATTDRTTTGRARIQKVVDTTTTGKARIQKVTDVTQNGKARIQAVVDRTQSGKARITATTDRTTTGKARIQKVTDATQTGKADIRATTDQTITGKADIRVTTDRTTTGKARITASTDRTTTGKARIQKVADTTITGVAKIAVTGTTEQSIFGKANIRATTDHTITGTARIQKTVDQTIAGRARIQKVVDATQTGKADIRVTTDQTETGVARIQKTVDQTITGKARITNTAADKDITGKARITNTADQNITGVAKILVQGTTEQSIFGTARITATTDQVTSGKTRIEKTVDQNITGVAKIVYTTTDQNIDGTARIQKTVSASITGKGRIIPEPTIFYPYICVDEKTVIEQGPVPGKVISDYDENCNTKIINSKK